MFLKLRPFFYSLIFLIGLETIVLWRSNVTTILFFLLIFSIYQGKSVGKKWKFAVLPAFFTLSSSALLYLITIPYEKQIFIFLTASMYYLALFGAYRLSQYALDQTARAMNMAATVSTIFFTYTASYGLYLNFLVPLWVLMLVYLLLTLLVSFQYFSIIKENDKRIAWIYSFLLSLTMTEMIWTINFWPFGYLTVGVIALILYYVIWDLIQSYFLNLLSQKRVVANMIFFSVVIALVLLSSKWIPVI